ncbi:MAG: MCP four helix bundle domain-containing protein [Hydrogenophaga sp.]|uniref:methyl-accepting chemotaxis protein n=1 Tax=Hydrogenophaga sp. TaxID=1904254 RepID=UPI001E074376|nr:methyl-accepting chemotaxis protein [Hydrogenophaga sp.]MBX3609662.1 MCP four helix bundle domain-containing protein [Hydrogenophaga sp.]
MKQLAQFKIGTRLTLGFGLLIALMMTLAVVGYTRTKSIANDIELIVHDRFVNVSLAHRIENEVNKQLRAMRTAMIARDAAVIEQELHKMEASAPVAADAVRQLEASVHSPQGRESLAALETARQRFREEEARVVSMIRAGRHDEARNELLQIVLPLQTTYLNAIEAFGESQVKQMEQFGAEAAAMARQAEMLAVVLAITALALALVVATVLTRSITVPIHKAVRVARTVAGGDLTSRIEPRGRDELAELLGALRDMNEGLVRIVREVRDCSDSIATGSHQIAVGGVDLSQRTEEQASSVQQTAASMEQISTSVRHSADTSRTATELARNASAVAADGGQAMAGVVSTMGAITDSSRRIADITSVIDGIAFQTNILALNAAVEAARAGEHGRGFAVVAGEVRTLAQRAATAAKDIKGLIGESLDRVEAGSQQVEQAGATMGDIVAQAGKVSELIGELGAGFEEQSRGIGQVNDAVGQMDQVTQQNAALVEESAAAAESLRLQASRLTELVGTFRLAA